MTGLPTAVRIDKWLWAVRVFKARALATEACRRERVCLDGQTVRPAREVRPGQTVTVDHGGWTQTLRVRAAIERRVGAGLVAEQAEDLTSAEERARGRERRIQNLLARPAGAGRPTKGERRAWEKAFRGGEE